MTDLVQLRRPGAASEAAADGPSSAAASDTTAAVTGAARLAYVETYGVNTDRVANPEVHLRWALARGAAADLGIELRFYLPIEDGSRFGFMVGLPIRLRAGSIRLDTGLYVPIIFTDPTTTIVSVPLHLWIQATSRLWVGPLFGLRVTNRGGSDTEYPFGIGLGTMLTGSIDLRTWFMFPDISRDAAARYWGAGLALQVRFE